MLTENSFDYRTWLTALQLRLPELATAAERVGRRPDAAAVYDGRRRAGAHLPRGDREDPLPNSCSISAASKPVPPAQQHGDEHAEGLRSGLRRTTAHRCPTGRRTAEPIREGV